MEFDVPRGYKMKIKHSSKLKKVTCLLSLLCRNRALLAALSSHYNSFYFTVFCLYALNFYHKFLAEGEEDNFLFVSFNCILMGFDYNVCC